MTVTSASGRRHRRFRTRAERSSLVHPHRHVDHRRMRQTPPIRSQIGDEPIERRFPTGTHRPRRPVIDHENRENGTGDPFNHNTRRVRPPLRIGHEHFSVMTVTDRHMPGDRVHEPDPQPRPTPTHPGSTRCVIEPGEHGTALMTVDDMHGRQDLARRSLDRHGRTPLRPHEPQRFEIEDHERDVRRSRSSSSSSSCCRGRGGIHGTRSVRSIHRQRR